MKKESLLPVLCILLLVFFSTCNKDDDNNGNGNDPVVTGEEIPFEDVQTLFDAIESQINDDFQAGSSIPDIIKNTGDMLKSNSLVSHMSDYSGDEVTQLTFEMINGMIVNIPFIPQDLKGAGPGTELSRVVLTDQKKRSIGKTNTSNKENLTQVLTEQNPPCAVFSTLSSFTTGDGAKDLGPELKALASKHGWDADYGTYGMIDKFGNQFMGVEFFKSLNEYSLVYLGSHGLWTDELVQGKSFFLIMTDDLCNLSMHNQFWGNGDFFGQRVGVTSPWLYTGHADIPEFIEHLGYHYAITHYFIDHYCGDFPKNSMVVLDMCMGMTDNIPLIQVFVDKNVAEIFGWSNVVHWAASTGASKYLFTRLFGEIPGDLSGCVSVNGQNHYCTPKKEPPIRPFGLIETYEAIKEIGWHRDNKFPDSQGASFFYYPVPGSAGSPKIELNLIPSIYGMYYDYDIETEEKELTIYGNFGENKGKVTIDGKEVSCTWEHDEIVADMQGTDGGGPVIVEYNGLKSNPHPLTYWEGNLKVSGTLGYSQPTIEECEVFVQFRTEIVDERPDPEADPSPTYGHNGGYIEGESRVTASLTGSYSLYDCIFNFDIPYNKGKMINVCMGTEENFLGTVLIEGSKARFNIAIAWKGKVEKTCPPDPPEIEDYWVAIPLIFETDVNEDGTIPGCTVPLGGLVIEIEGDIVPEFPPTDETQR